MEYLDFVLSEVHGLGIKEVQEAKADRRKTIGTFCLNKFIQGGKNSCMRLAGIDVGSRTIELVVLNRKDIVLSEQADSGFDPVSRAKGFPEGFHMTVSRPRAMAVASLSLLLVRLRSPRSRPTPWAQG